MDRGGVFALDNKNSAREVEASTDSEGHGGNMIGFAEGWHARTLSRDIRLRRCMVTGDVSK